MTTLKELGILLSELGDNCDDLGWFNKELQKRTLNGGTEFQSCHDELGLEMDFDLSGYEYRLKPEPKVTYYRAYKNESGRHLAWRDEPFSDWVDGGRNEFLFDYKLSEPIEE